MINLRSHPVTINCMEYDMPALGILYRQWRSRMGAWSRLAKETEKSHKAFLINSI